ncbi:DNA methyltransferase [Amylibacter marinus]|uniref:DNA methyltransferase n=1 Tax=Amylibacter marinus TaxID=1475483 RepID=A0ABQ5VWK5_9RHOB|nr:16S rRNA (guanine(966)-N(2))-methyltransferase RsmD [Amylibacter marinus]GLQ35694.1 DNA methyltransferase [Amylibacter marinus]
MRIIGGAFRGTALASLGKGDAGAHLRPTTDRVRESIFNLLINGGYDDPITGMRVLDLFAGTGALGFEALSRGASFVLFVDDGVKARALVRQNTDILRAIGQTKLYRRDATRLGAATMPAFDLVFLDPPYGKGLGGRALLAAAEGGWIADDALIVWEESGQQAAPEGFDMLDARKYGDTWVHILQYINGA